jgi:predicted phage-related endonuclease
MLQEVFSETVKDFAIQSILRGRRTNMAFEDDVFYADDQVQQDMAEIKALKASIEKDEKRLKFLMDEVKKSMGNNTVLCTEDGEMLATYKPSSPVRALDWKQLKEDKPELYKQIDTDYGYLQKLSRPFVIKK